MFVCPLFAARIEKVQSFFGGWRWLLLCRPPDRSGGRLVDFPGKQRRSQSRPTPERVAQECTDANAALQDAPQECVLGAGIFLQERLNLDESRGVVMVTVRLAVGRPAPRSRRKSRFLPLPRPRRSALRISPCPVRSDSTQTRISKCSIRTRSSCFLNSLKSGSKPQVAAPLNQRCHRAIAGAPGSKGKPRSLDRESRSVPPAYPVSVRSLAQTRSNGEKLLLLIVALALTRQPDD
jgi:hypothetical protein